MQLFQNGDHLTVRVHDTKVVEQLNYILEKNPFRYKYKNDLLVELLLLGAREKIKSLNPKEEARRKKNIQSVGAHTDVMLALKQLRQFLENMHDYNQNHIDAIVAHLKMSERLSSAIYNTLLAIVMDEPITKIELEVGLYDKVPKRFEEYLNELLQSAFQKGENKEELKS